MSSSLNKSPQRRTLGKGGSKRSIPRLTGKGGILAAELMYSLEIPDDGFLNDGLYGEEYRFYITDNNYLVYGLMIYHLSVCNNEVNINLGNININVKEFVEEYIEDGDLNSHPKEFISYVYYKMTISSYSRFLEDFDTNLHHLVEDGYLTYDHDPFDGYFTIYQTMGYHSENHFSVDSLSYRPSKRGQRNSDNGYTIEYLGVNGRYFENRFIMNKLGDLGEHGWDLDLTGSNWDFNHIILILSLHLKDSLDRWDEGVRSGDGIMLFENRNYCQDHLYILLNIEDIIKRMIDEKYIYDKEGVFHSKIEIEALRI